MSSFFDRMFGRSSKGSSATAKDRLQFVLVHDRINLPPERMKEMKEEILAVISKYVAVDRDSVDIALEQRDRNSSKIVAEIPFSKERRALDLLEEDEDTLPTATTVITDESAPSHDAIVVGAETDDDDTMAEDTSSSSAQAVVMAADTGDNTVDAAMADDETTGTDNAKSPSADDAKSSEDDEKTQL